MVYGCMTRFGFEKLVRIEGKINAEKYIAILKDGLLYTLDDHFFFPWTLSFSKIIIGSTHLTVYGHGLLRIALSYFYSH